MFACAIPLAGQAKDSVATNPATIVEYRVVGVTTTQTDGAPSVGGLTGFAAMDQLCQNEMGADTRMATAREWQTTRNFPHPADALPIWLDPGPIEITFDPNSGVSGSLVGHPTEARGLFFIGGATPFEVNKFATCNSFTNNGFGSAITGTAVGRLNGSDCEESLKVGCSAPVAIPVRK